MAQRVLYEIETGAIESPRRDLSGTGQALRQRSGEVSPSRRRQPVQSLP
jgi:hypothetical protein